MEQSTDSQKFFKSNVEDYKKEHYESGYRTFMTVRHAIYLNELDGMSFLRGSKALDAGCGPGLLTKALNDRNFEVNALDSSTEMLNLARSLFQCNGTGSTPEFCEGNIEALPYDDGEFDLIVSAGVIEYLETDDVVLREFNRVLRNNAVLILSITNKLSPIGCLDFIVEAIKRNKYALKFSNWILTCTKRSPVRPRNFTVRKHKPWDFIASINKNGFKVIKSGYFYVLPWPHPFDRIFPHASSIIGSKLEFLSKTFMGFVSEGFYVVVRKVDTI